MKAQAKRLENLEVSFQTLGFAGLFVIETNSVLTS